LVEHVIGNDEVIGSIPINGSPLGFTFLVVTDITMQKYTRLSLFIFLAIFTAVVADRLVSYAQNGRQTASESNKTIIATTTVQDKPESTPVSKTIAPASAQTKPVITNPAPLPRSRSEDDSNEDEFDD
jgi:hypothetical protein